MYTYSHKTSPGFCAELSHRQSIHIMVRGDLLVRSFCLQLMTYIPLFLKLQMHAWIKNFFFFFWGGDVPQDNCLFAGGTYGSYNDNHIQTQGCQILVIFTDMSFIQNSITMNSISGPDHLHSETLPPSLSLYTQTICRQKNMKKFMPGSDDRGTRYVRAALGCQNYVTLACLYTD